jgi:hypothetical protein
MPTTNDDIDQTRRRVLGWYWTPPTKTLSNGCYIVTLQSGELCPICREFVTTYTQKDDAPIPLKTDVAAAVRGISQHESM